MSFSRGSYDVYHDKNGSAATQQGGEDSTEKTRLQQPVKLQPSWEEKNLPEDELNFKNLTMDEASLQLNQPPDKYNLVYITFLVHGIGVLMSWNMFITAIDYFQLFKLSEEYIGYKFQYLGNFMQYLTFCSQVPNVLFNWMNIFVQIGGNLTKRIVWSISALVIIFVVTVIMAMSDTSSFAEGFFWITMICVILLNMANGIYQNTIYGMAAKLPGKYTGAVVLGNNICGTFAALVSLFSMLFTTNVRMAAIYYFIAALAMLLICFDTYFALPLNRFYRHYELKEKKELELQRLQSKGIKERPPYLYVVKKAFPQLLNIFMVFLVTLCIFPAIHAGVKRSGSDFFIPDHLYMQLTCFMTFNVFAMLGSLLPSYFIWPGPKYLWIPVTLRFLYIPFYLLSNYQATDVTRILPVFITNDWLYWIVAMTHGFTHGYISSLGMMYAPRMVEDKYAPVAGMFAAAALTTGIFAGILLTFLWPWVIGHVGN